MKSRNSPGCPVVSTPCFQCRGCVLDPWSGNQDPTCRAVWQKNKKKMNSNTISCYPAGEEGRWGENVDLQLAEHGRNLECREINLFFFFIKILSGSQGQVWLVGLFIPTFSFNASTDFYWEPPMLRHFSVYRGYASEQNRHYPAFLVNKSQLNVAPLLLINNSGKWNRRFKFKKRVFESIYLI